LVPEPQADEVIPSIFLPGLADAIASVIC
jgi:hypothetical protein